MEEPQEGRAASFESQVAPDAHGQYAIYKYKCSLWGIGCPQVFDTICLTAFCFARVEITVYTLPYSLLSKKCLLIAYAQDMRQHGQGPGLPTADFWALVSGAWDI